MNQEPQPSWYEPLRALQSRGSRTKVVGGLAGLHEARATHLGQFWTPDALARFCWGLVETEVARVVEKSGSASILDTSIGSGRLLQFCNPKVHRVGGCDVDAEVIVPVQQAFEAAGFDCKLVHCGMEEISPRGWSLAMVNPPFSVSLSAPTLQAMPCTTFGRFGPNSSAQSDYYAVAQALQAASVVVAIIPRGVAAKIWTNPEMVEFSEAAGMSRQLARFDLPAQVFVSEGAGVSASVVVYSSVLRPLSRRAEHAMRDLGVAPVLEGLEMHSSNRHKLGRVGVDEMGGPSIKLPVTGDKQVRVAHDGRRIVLGYRCGFTQARVANAVLAARIWSTEHHRLPDGYLYAGQGKLDLQVHLLQPDPEASVARLIEEIRQQDAEVVIDPGFWPYVRRQAKRTARAAEPLAHTVWRKGASEGQKLTATARSEIIVDPSSWTSPVVLPGEGLTFEPVGDGRYTTTVGGKPMTLSLEEITKSCTQLHGLAEPGWEKVHKGLLLQFPDQANALRKRAEALGIPRWLSWGFQLDDLIELAMKPRGAVVAWEMGAGKTRLAVALVLLHGTRHNLITTHSYLVPEFVEKIAGTGIPASDWQVINTPDDLVTLRRINIISHERLRMELPGHRRVTYAHRLRRRVGVAITDEGEFLASTSSAQSRALWRVSASKRYVLTGTPLANAPKDLLPVLCYAAGSATAAQPWSQYGAYLDAAHVKTVQWAERGVARFMEAFIVLEWSTNLYAETLRNGAKREVPRLANAPQYRAMLAPHLKRRVLSEPEVAQHIKLPSVTKVIHECAFDDDHLAHYLEVADDFSSWMNGQDRKRNLLVILLRFNAVLRALNQPQSPAKHVRAQYSGRTSKQRLAVGRLAELAAGGHKTIAYAHSPETVEMLAADLRALHGIESVVLHGGITAAKRHAMLNDRFKRGPVGTLLATIASTSAGLNIPQADKVLFYDRDWTASAEAQALARVLRPETNHPVTAEFLHVKGSADEYQAQMVAFKKEAAAVGVDWAVPEMDDVAFEHIDTILGRFVADLAAMRGTKGHLLRQELRKRAA